jgi:DNA-binding MarR family transcriptional regulator
MKASLPGSVPCAAGTLRRASRSLTRLYDLHLAAAGLTTTQFSILRTLLRRGGSVPLAELGDLLVFERTSLYRALSPLRQTGLVVVRTGADRRAKDVALTRRGQRRTARARPYWTTAQRAVLDRFGRTEWLDLASRLGLLAAAARDAHGS